MASDEPSLYPSVALGRLRIPGPAIPIILVGSPFFVRRQTSRQKKDLQNLLVVIHLLLYIYNLTEIFGKKEKEGEGDDTLPLLEHLVLAFGEPALQEGQTSVWPYISVAVGWILSRALAHPQRVWISIVLSLPSALRMSKQVNVGVNLSALSLLTRMTFVVSGSEHGLSMANVAGVALPVALARLCYPLFLRKLCRALQVRPRRVLEDSIGEQCLKCIQAPFAVFTVAGAGWIISSFVFSCFPWRRLFNEEASRAPSWTGLSFAGGVVFLPLFSIVKFMRVRIIGREPAADLGAFVQYQLGDCVAATWWVSVAYILLWLGSEALSWCGKM